jgi:hypothetical protein
VGHITCVDNLAPILAADGVLAYNRLHGRRWVSIADLGIQDRRGRKVVPCGPGGTLHDYVPLYFAARSPMLYRISRGGVEGYTGGQEAVIYLVTTAQAVAEAGCGFVFTDGHGIMELSQFFDDLAHLDRIDWQVMRAQYWRDTDEDPDRSRRRQAEFLVYERLPWRLVHEVGVKTERMRRRVEKELTGASPKPPVLVRRGWYYD